MLSSKTSIWSIYDIVKPWPSSILDSWFKQEQSDRPQLDHHKDTRPFFFLFNGFLHSPPSIEFVLEFLVAQLLVFTTFSTRLYNLYTLSITVPWVSSSRPPQSSLYLLTVMITESSSCFYSVITHSSPMILSCPFGRHHPCPDSSNPFSIFVFPATDEVLSQWSLVSSHLSSPYHSQIIWICLSSFASGLSLASNSLHFKVFIP